MFRLILSEIKYNWIALTVLFIVFPVYTAFVLSDTQILTDPMFEIDYWGGFFGLLFYLGFLLIWSIRIKEGRLRLMKLLPASNFTIALARAVLLAGIMAAGIVYLTVIHKFVINTWYLETASIIGQIGMVFTVLSSFVLLRDCWFAIAEKKFSKYLAAVAVILIISVVIFIYIRPFFYEIIGRFYGIMVFSLWAMVMLISSVYSFNKRKSYYS